MKVTQKQHTSRMFSRNKQKFKIGKNKFFIKNVLSRDAIHGFKYLMDENLTYYERIFWAIVITVAFIGAAYNLRTIWVTYETNLLRTTILNTYFKYANIAFPSVTVCDSSRMDWHRIIYEEEVQNFVELAKNMTTEQKMKVGTDLKNLLAALSVAQFGTPKDLNDVKYAYRNGSRILDNLLLSQLMLDSARSCEQIFEPRCWWRNNYFNCCDLFEPQKTGYGYCYSFNSDISEKSKILSIKYDYTWNDWNNRSRPRKTSGHGVWTGLRFKVNVQDIPSYVNIRPGIIVFIGDPSGFPFENDLSVSKGKFASIGVWGDKIAATSRLKRLSISQRSCLFPREKRVLHRGYLRQNCIANCYRTFVQSNCNCSLDFIYFQLKASNGTKYAPCTAKHLECIADYNYAFNNRLSEDTIMYDTSKTKVESFCECPDDCENQKYVAKASTEVLEENPNQVVCDVHYERSFGTLFQTDVSFDYLDALVSYGGIAALFLGASLLSVTEIFYYIARRILSLYLTKRSNKAHSKKMINVNTILFYRKEYPRPYY